MSGVVVVLDPDQELIELLDDAWTVELFGPWVDMPREPIDPPPCETVISWQVYVEHAQITAVRVWQGEILRGNLNVRPSVHVFAGERLDLTLRVMRR